jgi:hypothetical protein
MRTPAPFCHTRGCIAGEQSGEVAGRCGANLGNSDDSWVPTGVRLIPREILQRGAEGLVA